MLDVGLHQAVGLHSFTPHSELRVVAVASEASSGRGLETLWQVCAHLQRLGYPVAFLDGTAQECEDSPGLAHLLQQLPWGDGGPVNLGSIASSLAVIPAATGLAFLAHRPVDGSPSPLQALLPYFRTYGLLVLYAPASTLGCLLTHTATVPLVVMGRGAAGVMSSYSSLKHIALHTGLPCMVAALLQSSAAAERRRTRAALATLQECAQRHLGGPVRTTTIAVDSPQDHQRLALQLLENAGTISESLNALTPSNVPNLPAHFVRSH
jgi:hypothetical protein